MWEREVTRETSASPDMIWAILCDVPGWTKWIEGLENIEMTGPFKAGSVLNMTISGQGHISTKVIEVKENEGFTDETRLGDVVVRVNHRLECLAPKQTRIVYAVHVSGPSAEDIGQAVSADFPEVLKALATLAESKDRMRP